MIKFIYCQFCLYISLEFYKANIISYDEATILNLKIVSIGHNSLGLGVIIFQITHLKFWSKSSAHRVQKAPKAQFWSKSSVSFKIWALKLTPLIWTSCLCYWRPKRHIYRLTPTIRISTLRDFLSLSESRCYWETFCLAKWRPIRCSTDWQQQFKRTS